MNQAPNPVLTAREEAAARMLHEAEREHGQLIYGSPMASWGDATEGSRRSKRSIVAKARGSFEDFYAFMTLAERQAGIQVPSVHEDTERVRGHRMQYAIVQHFTQVEDVAD
ncbi:hypothetical protein [Streptomyces sp. ME19-01-6]|uniref:hypothetical protein n=1 Tax=Streptomyces sp. ME19-01-6 TaxID=3028686 RepID=UPI0029BE589E|nr:hypothetical protein [Streptomyces sp. ME19-01-6]MDX3232886.1 hypothetical protein [Streptomyces sp. ME19-01-6]